MPLHAHTTRRLAAALTGLALTAPAARADSQHLPPAINEQEKQTLASRALAAPTPPPKTNPSAPNPTTADDTFDWTTAGIGTGTIAGLIILAAGLSPTRRTHINSNPRPS